MGDEGRACSPRAKQGQRRAVAHAPDGRGHLGCARCAWRTELVVLDSFSLNFSTTCDLWILCWGLAVQGREEFWSRRWGEDAEGSAGQREHDVSHGFIVSVPAAASNKRRRKISFFDSIVHLTQYV